MSGKQLSPISNESLEIYSTHEDALGREGVSHTAHSKVLDADESLLQT
jgi:hypothetical protein